MKERKQKTLAKRLLVAMLSVMMTVTFIPTSLLAFAAEPEEPATDDVQSTVQNEVVQEEPIQAVQKDEPQTEPTEATKEQPTTKAKADKGTSEKAKADKHYFKDLETVRVDVFTEEDAFAEKVKLVVEPLEEDSDAFKDAEKALAKSKQTYDGILAYDIHFESVKTGKEIEPEGTVSVEMQAKAKGLKGIAAKDFNAASVQMSHIVGKKAEVVADTYDKKQTGIEGMVEVDKTKKAVRSIETAFEVDSFSTFTFTWKNADDENESAKIHWGSYDEAGVFQEFESITTVDTTASSVDLRVTVTDYYYVGVEYKGPNDTEPETVDASVLKKTANGWTLGDTEVEDGSDIYVNYAPIGSGGYTPPDPPPQGELKPDTEKTVTYNNDGTYTIQLDIEGKADHSTVQTAANVVVIMDITQSMTNNMPGGGGTRMAAAKRALTTLIDTLKPSTNKINFTAVNFGNSANYSNGVQWTAQESAMRNYVNGLPNNPNDLGTCWQAGLQGGIDRVGTAPAGNETYVIFITDGNPNGWVNAQGRYQQQGAGGFVQAAYNAAVPNANTLGSLSHFYGVFVGDADGYDHLEDLINGAHGEDTINGTSTSDINDAFAQIATTIVNNLGAGNTVVDDGLPTLSNVSANVAAGDAGGFEYFITEPLGEQRVWEEAPGASYDKTNGVTWDLGEVGELANGTIYTLKFIVWPSQAAYDTIADLNNGLIDFDDLTPEQQESIEGDKTTGYTLKTNTHLFTTFTDNDGKTYRDVIDASAKAMELPTTTIKVVKDWNNEMDAREATDVTLTVTKDGDPYKDVVMGEPVKTGDHTWRQTPTDEIYISYGQIVHGEVKETGHEYTVVEPESFSYRWDLTADIYRPMIIDGVKKVLIKTNNPEGTEGEDYYVIDGKNYQVTTDSEHVLYATNDRRSNLAINKEVTGQGAPADAVFPIKITVDEVDGHHPGDEDYDEWYDTIWFAVQTDPADRDTVVKEGVQVDGATAEEGNTGFYWFDNGGTVTVYLKAGQYICLTNLPKGTEYTVEELSGEGMPDGFAFVKATSDADNKAGGTSTPATIEDNVAEGTIDQSNTDYSVTYTNKYEETDITVTKEWVDDSNQAGIRPTVADFADCITLLQNGKKAIKDSTTDPATEYEPVITDNEDDTYTIEYTELPKYINGEAAVYTVDETTVPVGYTVSTTPVEAGGTITNTCSLTSVTVDKVWMNAGETVITPPQGASVVFTLYNGDTATSTVTLDGTADTKPTGTTPVGYESKAWTAKFINLPKKDAEGKTIEYTVKETTVPAGFTVSPTDPVEDGETIYNIQVPKELDIIKSVDDYIDHANDDGTAVYPSFAFHVIGYSDVEMSEESIVLDTVVGVDFANFTGNVNGNKSKKTLKNLPAEVVAIQVEEIAFGNYTPNPKGLTSATETKTGHFEVTFDNTLTPPPPPDYQSGVVNNYVKGENGYSHPNGQ